MSNANLGTSCEAEAVVKKGPSGGADRSGMFHAVCRKPDGSVRWKDSAKNGVTNVGNKHSLDVVFGTTVKVAPWFIGLIQGPSGSVTLSPTDTLSAHPGWSFATASHTGNRLEWLDDAATSAASSTKTNTVSTDFSITATDTIFGMALTDHATIDTGILWSTAAFSGDKSVSNGDTLEVTYTITSNAT